MNKGGNVANYVRKQISSIKIFETYENSKL